MTFACFKICSDDVEKPKNKRKKTKQVQKKDVLQINQQMRQKSLRKAEKISENKVYGKQNKRKQDTNNVGKYVPPYYQSNQPNIHLNEDRLLMPQIPSYKQSDIIIDFSGDSNKIPAKKGQTVKNIEQKQVKPNYLNVQKNYSQKVSTKSCEQEQKDIKPYTILRERKKKRIFFGQTQQDRHVNFKCPTQRPNFSGIKTINQDTQSSRVIVNTNVEVTNKMAPIHITDKLMTTSAIK